MFIVKMFLVYHWFCYVLGVGEVIHHMMVCTLLGRRMEPLITPAQDAALDQCQPMDRLDLAHKIIIIIKCIIIAI